MAVRVCTIHVPRFCHDGLEVDGAWRELDVAKLPKAARQAFVDYVGQFVQVHPDDEPELAKLGLEYFTAPDGRRRLRTAGAKAHAKT